MTIRQFGTLNRFRVPALAMTVDALLNVVLITYFSNPIEILAVSNIGYVFATCTALAAFLLLRKDRPAWPRPVQLADYWVPLAAVLLRRATSCSWSRAASSTRAASSGSRATATAGTRRAGACSCSLVALLLYVFRHVVQDKQPMRLREEVPATPEERAPAPRPGAGAHRDGLTSEARVMACGAREPRAPPSLRAQVPARQVRDRRAVAAAVQRADEGEPGRDAEREQDEDAERVAGEREEDGQRRDERAPSAMGTARKRRWTRRIAVYCSRGTWPVSYVLPHCGQVQRSP